MNYCKPVALNSVTCDLVGETKLFLPLGGIPGIPAQFMGQLNSARVLNNIARKEITIKMPY